MKEQIITMQDLEDLIKQGKLKRIWFDYDEYGLEKFIYDNCQKIKGNGDIEVCSEIDRRGFVMGRVEGNHTDLIFYKNRAYNEIYLTVKDDLVFYNTEFYNGIIFFDHKENDIDTSQQNSPWDYDENYGLELGTFLEELNNLGVFREKWSTNEIRGIVERVIEFHEEHIEHKEEKYKCSIIEDEDYGIEFLFMDCLYDCTILLKTGDLLLYSSKLDVTKHIRKDITCSVDYIEEYYDEDYYDDFDWSAYESMDWSACE